MLFETRYTLPPKGKLRRKRYPNNAKLCAVIGASLLGVLALISGVYLFSNPKLRRKLTKKRKTMKNTDIPFVQVYPAPTKKKSRPYANATVEYSHLEVGQVEHLHAMYQGARVKMDPYLFRTRLPPTLVPAIMSYLEEIGLDKVISSAVRGRALDHDTDQILQLRGIDHELLGTDQVKKNEVSTWYSQRGPAKFHSNMHWISPSNQETFDQVMSVLGSGGFDTVLKAVGEHFPHLKNLAVIEATFIPVSYCVYKKWPYLHDDFDYTDGKLFNFYMPLVRVDGSPPEFALQSRKGATVGYHFEDNIAIGFGDGTQHGTSTVDYTDQGKYRMAMSIFIADITDNNVKSIAKAMTGIFPPIKDVAFTSNWLRQHQGINYHKGAAEGQYRMPRRRDPATGEWVMHEMV